MRVESLPRVHRNGLNCLFLYLMSYFRLKVYLSYINARDKNINF